MPTLVVDLFHRGWPKPRLQLRELLGSDRTGPSQTPVEADRDPPQTRVDSHPPPARAESLLPLTRAVNQPPQVEVGYQQPREVLSILPQVGEEWVIVPRLTGTKWSCAKPRVEPLTPKGRLILRASLLWILLVMLSPLMQLASQSEDPTAGSHSPRSETGMVSGEMADLSLTSPSQPGPGEDETQQ